MQDQETCNKLDLELDTLAQGESTRLSLCERSKPLTHQEYKKERSTLHFLISHLLPYQELIKSASKVNALIQASPELEKNYANHLVHTRALVAKSKKSASDIGKLIYSLQILNLKNRWYFFSNTGRLLAAYKLLVAEKEQLANLIYEMGKTDAQLSLVKLIQESEAYKS